MIKKSDFDAFDQGALTALSILLSGYGNPVSVAFVLGEMDLDYIDVSMLDTFDRRNFHKMVGISGVSIVGTLPEASSEDDE